MLRATETGADDEDVQPGQEGGKELGEGGIGAKGWTMVSYRRELKGKETNDWPERSV